MIETYPFFREEDERTQAVIGEDAIASDLEGTYQKPYAVLTQKRLYCKNQQGNLIVDNINLRGSSRVRKVHSLSWLLWIAFAHGVFEILLYGNYCLDWFFCDFDYNWLRDLAGYSFPIIVCLALFLILRRRTPLIAPAFLCIHPLVSFFRELLPAISELLPAINGSFFLSVYTSLLCSDWGWPRLLCQAFILLPAILVIIYYIANRGRNYRPRFVVSHSTGVFTFFPELYRDDELNNFEIKLKDLKSGVQNGQQ